MESRLSDHAKTQTLAFEQSARRTAALSGAALLHPGVICLWHRNQAWTGLPVDTLPPNAWRGLIFCTFSCLRWLAIAMKLADVPRCIQMWCGQEGVYVSGPLVQTRRHSSRAKGGEKNPVISTMRENHEKETVNINPERLPFPWYIFT